MPFIQKIEPFLPFSKKQEKGCPFTIFVYTLNMSYTFKFKSAFKNQKCALKNTKSALFMFSAPCPFLRLEETPEKKAFSSMSESNKCSLDSLNLLLERAYLGLTEVLCVILESDVLQFILVTNLKLCTTVALCGNKVF